MKAILRHSSGTKECSASLGGDGHCVLTLRSQELVAEQWVLGGRSLNLHISNLNSVVELRGSYDQQMGSGDRRSFYSGGDGENQVLKRGTCER